MEFEGKVVKGMGFAALAFGIPTANLEFDEVILAKEGVYVAWSWVGEAKYPAVVYIGPEASEKFEVHLFGFSGYLYDLNLKVQLIEEISAYVPWESEEQMKLKVADDVAKARAYFSIPSSSV